PPPHSTLFPYTTLFRSLRKVEKKYDNGFKAVHGIDLDIREGEFMVFVGPSGCAKSTTLRMIAGLESITGGEIRIGNRVVNDLPPDRKSTRLNSSHVKIS